MFVITTNNTDETLMLGECLGKLLGPGDFIALTGDLGSGKTQFVKGVARGLVVDRSVLINSPTYTLLNEYQGRDSVYHFDLYRLDGDGDIVDLGFADYFHGRGVSLVEWAERLESELPEERLAVSFAYAGEMQRQITFEPFGERYVQILRELAAGVREQGTSTTPPHR